MLPFVLLSFMVTLPRPLFVVWHVRKSGLIPSAGYLLYVPYCTVRSRDNDKSYTAIEVVVASSNQSSLATEIYLHSAFLCLIFLACLYIVDARSYLSLHNANKSTILPHQLTRDRFLPFSHLTRL